MAALRDLVPGKRTLTEGLGHGSHRAPPPRVADTAPAPNVVLRVLVYNAAGEVIQRWESKGRWEGALPQRYTATRRGQGWAWDNSGGSTIRVSTNRDGHGGRSVESWASTAATRIVVHAYAVEDVTLDEEAQESDGAPGHARTTVEERLVDGFERDLGIDPGDEELDDRTAAGTAADTTQAGQTHGGEGSVGGDVDGRTGGDTRVGGTGPGGDHARPGGQDRSSDASGRHGSAGGAQDDQKGGAAGGMYGGKGKLGEDGVPSGSALFGGLIGIPAALKGLVELALIISDGNITGAGAGLFRQGLGKIVSASAARRMIASEARRAAVKETKAALKAIQADKVKSAAWNAATKAEREAATRRIYWELQRTFFDAYQKAAKQAKREARAALDKAVGNAAAQQKLKQAELAEEATDVKPVAGRLPQNHDHAGQAFPTDLLPPKYRSKGLRFTKEGYPDFAPHARQLPTGKNHVEIEYTGSRRADEAAANRKAKLDDTPRGWTWHHAEDMKTMHLVPDELHKAVRHSGGVARYKHGSGVPRYGE